MMISKTKRKKSILNSLFIGLFFLLLSQISVAVELLPLKDYLKIHDVSSDPVALGYVCLRCAAVSVTQAALFGSFTDKNRPNKEEIAKKIAKRELGLVSPLLQFSNKLLGHKTPEMTIEYYHPITTEYAELMKKNFAGTGSYFLGSFIQEDIEICRNIGELIDVFIQQYSYS